MLKLYNTLTRTVEEFKPKADEVRYYSCGPTVYDFAHIGNFRAYVVADLIKRVLKLEKYSVYHVMNLTDVDDKTIRRSQEQGVSLKDFTEKYSKFFFEDLESLGIQKADVYPKATEHIAEMIKIIETLLDKKTAYKAQDGIYFDIAKFKHYGELAHINLEDLKIGARIASDEYDKQTANDFALWKFYTPKDGDVVWDAPFGKGRPGWHIECSAMSMKYLGDSFDLHSGGIDLVFPHHQNEIAQSEAATGKKFVNYWVHNEHLIVDGKKMSKSLGNFYTLRDIMAKGYSPMAVRYALLSVHYRQQLNFTFESLDAAQVSVDKFNDFYGRVRDFAAKGIDDSVISQVVSQAIALAKSEFTLALEEDINISSALAAVHSFVSSINQLGDSLSSPDAKAVLSFMDEVNDVLGIINTVQDELEPHLFELANLREKARKEKNFALADKLRAELLQKGIRIDDLKDGFRWKRV